MIVALAAGVKFGLLASGWYRRRLENDRLPGVLVLCYHGLRGERWRQDESAFPNLHVAAATFEGHCQVLADLCQPISLDDWRAALVHGRPLPERPALMTFDDGYRSVFDVARPILSRLGIRASVFVCTDPIRRQRLFWFDALARLQGESAVAQLRSGRAAETAAAAARMQVAARADDPLAPMTIDQVQTLARDGFEIGVHTTTHALLAAGTFEQQHSELMVCRDTLTEWLGRPVRAMAYPWGMPGIDYTGETVTLAASLGFDFAFTTMPRFAASHEPPLERSRFLMLSEVTPSELAHRIAYAWR